VGLGMGPTCRLCLRAEVGVECCLGFCSGVFHCGCNTMLLLAWIGLLMAAFRAAWDWRQDAAADSDSSIVLQHLVQPQPQQGPKGHGRSLRAGEGGGPRHHIKRARCSFGVWIVLGMCCLVRAAAGTLAREQAAAVLAFASFGSGR
jgi:hypothetical protein